MSKSCTQFVLNPCGSCRVHAAKRGSCKIKIEGARCIIDCDRCQVFLGGGRPDFVVLRAINGQVMEYIIIEIKATINSAGHVLRQIEAALKVLERQLSGPGLRCAAVVVRERRIRSQVADALTSSRLKCFGRRVPVVVKECGAWIR